MAGKSVTIIGAGIAGLAAAARLLKEGIEDVVVLEASSRVGGRIHSTDFNENGSIEMGAQWIHGETDNELYDIANGLGLTENPGDSVLEDLGEDFVDEEGDFWDDDLMDKLWEIADAAEDEQEDHSYDKATESMGSYFESKFAAQSERKQGSKKTLKKLKVFQDYYHRYYQNLDGCDHWKEDSFHGSAHIYEECEGNDMIPFKGNKSYSDVLKHFLDQIPGDKIKFDSRVETIDYSAEDSVKVVLADGQSRMSQHVIVTVSLGVLKHEAESMFVPALPKSKLEAIRNIGFGVVDKIFLEWKEPWWPVEDSEGIAFLYQEPIDYTKEDAEMDWTRFVCGFYRVLHRPNVMCLWLSGHGARVMEGRTEEKVQMQVMTFLRKFLTKECGTIPEPTGMKISRWDSDPLARGSYSFQTVTSVASDQDPGSLAEPVGNGRILFAGEATSQTHFSTAHGAMETGYREADRIITAEV